jgi:hypothetical protein
MRKTRKLRREAPSFGIPLPSVTMYLNATNIEDWKRWDRHDH